MILLAESLQRIFEQNPKYFKLIDAYFEKHPMPRVSWIQDIAFRRYQQASLALIEEADSEKMLEVKNVRSHSFRVRTPHNISA
jgi:hypothetical protein